jgi:hypothetical protein
MPPIRLFNPDTVMMPRVPTPGEAIGSTFDPWIFRHLLPWLGRDGFSEQLVKERFVEFGQGVASMSPALRDLEQVLLEGNLAHGGHPILSMCVSHTVIVLDDAGNRKPSKRKSTAKIDGLVALTMAIGVAPLQAKPIDIEALIAWRVLPWIDRQGAICTSIKAVKVPHDAPLPTRPQRSDVEIAQARDLDVEGGAVRRGWTDRDYAPWRSGPDAWRSGSRTCRSRQTYKVSRRWPLANFVEMATLIVKDQSSAQINKTPGATANINKMNSA